MTTVLIPPVLEPISLSEAKQHLRVDFADDDALIESLIIPAAREMLESDTQRSLLTQTKQLVLDELGCIEIFDATVQSISSVTYLDTDNARQTLAAEQYELYKKHETSLIVPAYNITWPASISRHGAVTVDYVAGYQSLDLVPVQLKQAMLLLIADFYENRQDMLIGLNATHNAFGYERLIKPFISYGF